MTSQMHPSTLPQALLRAHPGKKIIAITLIIAFFFASTLPGFAVAYPIAEGTYTPPARERLPLEEMSRELQLHSRPYDEIAADMEALLATATDELYLHTTEEYQTMYQLLLEFSQLMDEMDRVHGLAQLDKNMNLSDETQLAYYMQVVTEIIGVSEIFSQLVLQLIHSPFNQLMRDLLGDDYDDFQVDPEETARFSLQELELITQVTAYGNTGVTIEVDGVNLTLSDIDAVYDELEPDDFAALFWEINEKRNALRAPLYIELINLRNAYARSQGYADYVDYAMGQYYGRDFSAEEMGSTLRTAAELFSELREEILDLLLMIPFESGLDDYQENEWIYPYLESVQTLMERTPFEALVQDSIDRNLLVINDHPDGYEGAYMMPLSYPGDGLMYISNDTSAIFLLWPSYIHELGHLIAEVYEAYEGTPLRSVLKTEPFYVETLETHSTGLEMLLLYHAADILQEDAAAGTLLVLNNHLRNLVDAAIATEFEIAAHQMPQEELTVENLNRLYRKIGETYGINFYFTDTDVSFGWSDIPHYYESPFYYASYGLAALVAFDFLSINEDDYLKNFDKYTQVIRLGTNIPFHQMIAAAGITDPFVEENLTDIYERFFEYVDHVLSESFPDEVADEDELLLQEAS
ncbi:hypothetical protein [Anoxynatronum buryatiense]|uniref:Oligoendopeptidase F n=1 Tax=Anoxynatronum buryatiense TaxID=489973 RepID=A0AA46AJV5_9CLOT|nr:hypothetical protein [Anoxynatronum buryatiense]SMP66081.1 Oligoendopeptidase F [Anoxynatronum buryatiense]